VSADRAVHGGPGPWRVTLTWFARDWTTTIRVEARDEEGARRAAARYIARSPRFAADPVPDRVQVVRMDERRKA
jgi:choline dehydrogenase-like flavoprotein